MEGASMKDEKKKARLLNKKSKPGLFCFEKEFTIDWGFRRININIVNVRKQIT